MISLQPFLDELDLPIYIFPSHEHKNNETTVMCCLHVHTAAQQRKREIFYCIASSRLLVGFLFLVAVSTNAVGFLYVASVEDGSGFVQSKASKRQLANLIGCWRLVSVDSDPFFRKLFISTSTDQWIKNRHFLRSRAITQNRNHKHFSSI